MKQQRGGGPMAEQTGVELVEMADRAAGTGVSEGKEKAVREQDQKR